MTTSDQILLAQTVGVWVAVIVAPATVWAMFRQTQLAANIAQQSRRQECVERLLALSLPQWPPRGGAFYRVLNSVPALFAFDRDVLELYREFRDLEVHRNKERSAEAYRRLLMSMAAASGLPLEREDIEASFGVQWGASSPAR